MKRTRTVEAQYRASTTDQGHVIEGYAALYNVPSQPLYTVYDADGKRMQVIERIAPGAFDEAAGPGADVTCNINHNDAQLLGRTTSGTTRLTPDTLGLRFLTDVPDVSYARDLGVLMQRGDIRDCSFAFTVDQADIERSVEGDFIVETIKRIAKLYDVAIVTRGAYPQPFSEFRDLPEEGQEFHIQDLVFRYSQEDKPAASPREGAPSSEQTALRTQQEHSRALEVARLELQSQTVEV